MPFDRNPFTLGLDLGPNSIGWALVRTDFDERGEPVGYTGLLDTSEAGHPPVGVRVFEEGVANLGSSREKPRAQERRIARSARRVHARRSARRRDLRETLVEAGFLPNDPQDLERLLARTDPYDLRARGLDEALLPHEVGRALYHLSQRRGFKSNRKSGQSKEDRGMLAEISELRDEIAESGARTLGEYLNRLRLEGGEALLRGELRLRKRHTHREMYEKELGLLLNAQAAHHPGLAGIQARVVHCILYQHDFLVTPERREKASSRANLHRSPMVRRCLLEPEEFCASKGSWIFQEFRILKEVNNLRISEHYRDFEPITGRERDLVLELLRSQKEVKFDKLRKEFAKLERDPLARFNLEEGNRDKLLGNSVDALLAGAIGKSNWKKLEEDERHRLRRALEEEEDENEFRQAFRGYELPEKQLEKLLNHTPADSHGRFSEKALGRLLPLLTEGKMESEAIAACYPEQQSAVQQSWLPALVEKSKLPRELHDLTNPLVRRALSEVRKVVNAIVREHGIPGQIVVELAREMKQGKLARDETSKRMRGREKLREAAADLVRQLGGNPNSREDILRVLLWEEQGHRCLYTGRAISQTALFSGETDIDHIAPRWRSGDDSQGNKVLTFRATNLEKGSQTPAEWLGEGSQAFLDLIQRATERCEAKAMPWGKLRRLRELHPADDAFLSRQLNDTQYLSRLAVHYLELLYPLNLRIGQKAVRSTRGGLTAELRRRWGLNGLIEPFLDRNGVPTHSAGGEIKIRSDHRHHAVDAVVVALSSRSSMKRYQDAWKARETHRGPSPAPTLEITPPWPGIREDLYAALQEVVVSHRVQAKLSGALHEATFYGTTRDWSGEEQEGVFVVSTPVASLTKAKHLAEIRDRGTRELLERHARRAGWNGSAADLPKDCWEELPRRPSGVVIRKVRTLSSIKAPVELGHRNAFGGNNHHMVVVHPREGGKVLCRTVSAWELARRPRARGASLISREAPEGYEFAYSIARKESFLVRHPHSGEEVVVVAQKLAGASSFGTGCDLYLRDARDSRPATEGNKDPLYRLKSTGKLAEAIVTKLQVDPLGRATPAHS